MNNSHRAEATNSWPFRGDMADDAQLCDRLAALFLERAPVLLERLTSAIAAQDWPEVGSQAHALAGTCCHFDLMPVVDDLQVIEVLARDGIPPTQDATDGVRRSVAAACLAFSTYHSGRTTKRQRSTS